MRRAARRRGSGSSAMAGSTPPSSLELRFHAGDGGLHLGRERGGAGPASEAGAHLGAPEPALVGGGFGLVQIAGGQLHRLDADAIELVRVILERERQQLEHVRR